MDKFRPRVRRVDAPRFRADSYAAHQPTGTRPRENTVFGHDFAAHDGGAVTACILQESFAAGGQVVHEARRQELEGRKVDDVDIGLLPHGELAAITEARPRRVGAGQHVHGLFERELSFGAVAILVYVAADARRDGWLWAWWRAQLAITVGLMPMTLALFQQISLVAPLANAFAIPIVSLLVAPLALVAAVLPIDAIARLAHSLVAALMVPLEALGALPGAVWQQHAPPTWTVALAALGVAWLLAPGGVPARFAATPLFAPLLLVVPPAPAPGTAWVDILDVGQGLAAAVRTANHLLVYDTGPTYGPEADAGGRIVVPYLRGVGSRMIDRMVISHLDSDHSGGARSIAAVFPVGVVSSSFAAAELVPTSAYRPGCVRGERWEWDGVRFEMLHPQGERYGAAQPKTNEMSCVLRVSAAGPSILLTGDIERASERELVAKSAADLRADVLLVPHHGSRTSSTEPFIDAVAPQHAIVPVGYRNRFGHPKAEVIERYRRRGIAVYRTDTSGAIRVELGANGVTIREFRRDEPRYWR